MANVLTEEIKEKYEKEGLAVIPNFLSETEVKELREECDKLVKEMNPDDHRSLFSSVNKDQTNDEYFVNSNDKIRFFFEKDSVVEGTNIDKKKCLNKIGHALHVLNPVFKKHTFSSKVREVAIEMRFIRPIIPQAMYIFKQPRIGSTVVPHQDSTYLRNDPLKLLGLWIPLHDTTLENGCLWYVPGSHKNPVDYSYVRNIVNGKLSSPMLKYVGEKYPEYEDWVPIPVNKGSLVLIHGQVMHKSEHNYSSYPRHAYTFHILESLNSVYSPDNWLQETNSYSFPRLFD